MKLISNPAINKVLIACIFMGQAIGALYLLTPSELSNREPIYTGDYPAFFYRCVAMSEFVSKSGNVGGYDPYLKAGYVFPSSMGDGARIMQILTYLSPSAWNVFIIKWYVMIVLLLIPLLLYLTAHDFDLSERETAVLLTSGLVLWWIPLYPYYMAVFGLVNFVLASYLSLYIAALLYKMVTEGGWRPTLLLSVLIPLVVLIHMESLVLIFPLLAVCASVYGWSKRIYLRLLLFLVLAVVLNGFWLVPYLQDSLPPIFHSIFPAARSVAGQDATVRHLTETNLFKNLKSFFTGVSFPLAIIAVVGYYRLAARGEKVKFYLLLAAASFFALLNYFGSSLPGIILLQPIRFKLPMLLYLLVPVSVGVSYLYEKIMQRSKRLKPVLMPVLLFLLCITTICAIPMYRSQDHFNATLHVEGRKLLDWIKTSTDRKARILLEGDDLSMKLEGSTYYGGHFPMLLPYLSKREYISTTFPGIDFPGFSNGILFTQDIGDYKPEDFKNCFDLYNVQWIICWSEPAVAALMAQSQYTPLITKIDRFYIFQVHRKPSYYVKGSGDAEADYNTLRLTNVKSEEGTIIIKYHWADGLRTIPERVIRPVYIGSDPYGFIEILDPPESLMIRYLR